MAFLKTVNNIILYILLCECQVLQDVMIRFAIIIDQWTGSAEI